MCVNMRPRVKMGIRQGDVGPRENAGRVIYFVVDNLIIAFSRRAAFLRGSFDKICPALMSV